MSPARRMRSDAATAAAGWGVACLLAWGVHDVWPETPPPICSRPSEAVAEGGWTRVVACEADGAPAPPLRGPARLLFGERIDVNRADERTLDSLPGIGPARAGAIAAERCRSPFADLDALARVHGIGPRTIETLRPWTEARAVAATETSVACRSFEDRSRPSSGSPGRAE